MGMFTSWSLTSIFPRVNVVTAPRPPGLSSLNFPLMLSTQRKTLVCLLFPEAVLLGRRGEAEVRNGVPEEKEGGRNTTVGRT
jgi:hypothetical protein